MNHLKLQRLQISACLWLVFSWWSKHQWHSVTNSRVYHHQWHLLRVMIQIVNGWEMSLANQYFDVWLFTIKQQVAVFLEMKNKIQLTANTWRAFQLQDAVISSTSSQITTFWLKNFVNSPTWKLFWKISFSLGLVKLIHY